LWNYGKKATEIMPNLVRYVLLGGMDDSEKCLGIAWRFGYSGNRI
jgi:2-dehydro-3-deoxygluconokinase